MKNNVVVVNEVNNEDKPDCFAWLSNLKCNALIKKSCKNCRFYKNKSDVPNYEKYKSNLKKG